jgi:hypothetical protein
MHIHRKLVPLALAFASATVAQAAYTPIALTPGSYNADVVVEKTAIKALAPGGYTTATLDNGSANTANIWNEQGFFSTPYNTVGLPPAGTSFTDQTYANITYTMAPDYTTNNGIMLDATSYNGLYTFTFVTPAAFSQLVFLTSGGNGGCTFRWTAHHQDGTTETGTQPSADWFNGPNPAYSANGRVDAQSFALNNYGGGNPHLYGKTVSLSNTTSPVVSVDLQYVSSNSGAHTCIMAVSGNPGTGTFSPIAVTGYNADLVVEAAAGPCNGGNLAAAPITQYTTATMDAGTNNTGNTWYEQGYATGYPNTGLPAAGSILVSTNLPDHSYQMAPSYGEPNAIYADMNNSTATVTFVTPATYSALSFLSSDGNGAITVEVLINHQDGSTETNSFVSKDWFNGTPSAYNANGRVNVTAGTINQQNGGNPRLYEAQFLVNNQASKVVGATLMWTPANGASTSSRFVVLAISGTAGTPAPLLATSPSDVDIGAGSNAVYTVSVTGTGPFTYQWQAAGANGIFTNLTDGGAVSGSHTATLTITGATTAWSGATFQAIVSNAGGSVTSGSAALTVYSTLPNLAQPGDGIVSDGGDPNGSPEWVQSAIDGTTQKYLNFGLNSGSPFLGPCGMIWTPQLGSVIVSGVRIFPGNDSPERDPANVILYGSNDGGAHWSLIISNLITLPTTRNTDSTADPVSLTNCVFGEDDFVNTAAYTSYKLDFTLVRNNAIANSFAVAEVQFLGIVNPSTAPFFTQMPQSAGAYDRGSATFAAAATGVPNPSYLWAKVSSGGVYTLLSDGGNISGSLTPSLTVNPATYSDVGNYVAIATNTQGAATSAVASLSIVSLLTNVAYPTDGIMEFGDLATNNYPADIGTDLIDGTTTKWQIGGSGFSVLAGFGPFQGPVGVVLTNLTADLSGTWRPTLVVGLRFFTADANTERDPADYLLEGSADGNTFQTISSGSLNLPLARNAAGSLIDPLADAELEVFFANSKTFPVYRVTFNNTRNDNTASSLQLAELQFLGQDASVPVPALSVTRGTVAGTLNITASVPSELFWSTNLTSGAWIDAGPISGTITVTPSAGTPMKYYRLGAY